MRTQRPPQLEARGLPKINDFKNTFIRIFRIRSPKSSFCSSKEGISFDSLVVAWLMIVSSKLHHCQQAGEHIMMTFVPVDSLTMHFKYHQNLTRRHSNHVTTGGITIVR